MALSKVSEIMQEAYSEHKAVMCFECVNYEQIAWSIETAEEEKRPVILMLYYDMTFIQKQGNLCKWQNRWQKKHLYP